MTMVEERTIKKERCPKCSRILYEVERECGHYHRVICGCNNVKETGEK